MAASGIGFPSPIQKFKPPVFFLLAPPGEGCSACPTLSVLHPHLADPRWVLPTQLALPPCDHRPMSHTWPLQQDYPPAGPPSTDSGAYRHTKLPLPLFIGPATPSAGLTTMEARCFPPINARLCSTGTGQRYARSLPASPHSCSLPREPLFNEISPSPGPIPLPQTHKRGL